MTVSKNNDSPGCFKFTRADNLLPVARVPIWISPVLIYFYIFVLTSPRVISIFFILTGMNPSILAGFLPGGPSEAPFFI
jgi:hypothetical protein